MRRRSLYAAAGALLSLGAPLGWLLLRITTGKVAVSAELASHATLYAYLFLGTLVAFTLFGLRLGAAADALEAKNQELARQAMTDALTGLYNAGHFHKRLREETSRSARGGAPLSLMMMDLDHFKEINDLHGHPVGDEVLTQVAEILRREVREEDTVFRIGGEEFAVLCPGAELGEAYGIAERVRASVELATLSTRAGEVRVRASFGVAALEGRDSPETLAVACDTALYTAKAEGRNRVVMAEPSHPVTAVAAR